MSDTQSSSPGSWPRSLWAGALSLFIPGLGQIFAGAWQLGIRLYLICALGGTIIIVGLTRVAPPTPAVMITFFIVGLALGIAQVTIAIDAVRRARRGYDRTRRPWYRSTLLDAVTMLTINGLLVSNIGWKSFYIPSVSNLPTLMVGDYLFSDIRQPTNLARGDMVVFQKTKPPAADYVKRVVGLPGDLVQLRQGILYINGKAVPREPTGSYPNAQNWKPPYKRYRETLPGGRSYEIVSISDNGPMENTPEYKVPALHYFVLGDNRDDSLDSRMLGEVGYVSQASLIGTMQTIYWSSDSSRIFKRID